MATQVEKICEICAKILYLDNDTKRVRKDDSFDDCA